jgi:hypothetical protein
MRRRVRRQQPARLFDPVRLVRGTMFPHGRGPETSDIPAYAWANFFVSALERLNRVDPTAASETASEFVQFHAGWMLHYYKLDVDAQARWMAQGFSDMSKRSFKRVGVRTRMQTSPRRVLFLADQIKDGMLPATEEQIVAWSRDYRAAAEKLSRRSKSRTPLNVDTVVAQLETHWRESREIAASMPRAKLGYKRHLLPFQDVLNLVDRPRLGGRPRKS